MITAYAEKLLENLFSLDWSEKVKVAQQKRIGKKEGINITHQVVDEKNKHIGEVTCFTTRPIQTLEPHLRLLRPSIFCQSYPSSDRNKTEHQDDQIRVNTSNVSFSY